MTHVDFQCCPLLDFWRTKVWISGTVGAFDSGKSKLAGYVSSFALELGGWPYASRGGGYTKEFKIGQNHQAVSNIWYIVGGAEQWLYPLQIKVTFKHKKGFVLQIDVLTRRPRCGYRLCSTL